MLTSAGDIIFSHVHRYPAMQLVDVYKLAHQASLGSEHAVSDKAAAQRWLAQELAGLDPGPDEPLPDPISPDGLLLRIHLRPFLAQDGDLDALIEAFVRTANEFRGSVAALESFWAEVVSLVRSGDLPFSPAEAQEFGKQMASKGYPAAHHSIIFRTSYHPAYRVVAREFWSGA